MAENNTDKNEEVKPMIGKPHNFMEVFQNIGIISAMVLGFTSRNSIAGTEQEKRIPDWVWSIIPEEFSIEDEVWSNIITSSSQEDSIVQIEKNFREMLNKDPANLSEGKYRVMLMEMRKEFLEQMRKPIPENKQGSCLIFSPITLKDPSCEFLKELKQCVNEGGTEEEIYQRQKEIAGSRYLLIKTSLPRRIVKYLRENKLEFISGTIFFTLLIIALIKKILS